MASRERQRAKNDMNNNETTKRPPGVCVPWEEAKKRYGEIQGNEEQIERIWRENDAEAYDYLWQCLLSF